MCPHFKENNGNEQRLNLLIRSEKQQNLTFRRRTRRSISKEELLLRCIAMLESKRYECRHESGHAVARIVIGDTLVGIRVDANAANRAGERGSTDSRAAEFECTWGGCIRNRNADEFDIQSRVSLNPNCSDCLERPKNRLTAIFAGSLATEHLLPKEHRPYAQFDQSSIDREFSYFAISPAGRFTIEKASKVRARALVCQEREAILALTEALTVGRWHVKRQRCHQSCG